MDYLIGIDVGTSAVKCVLFDNTGNAVAECSRSYPLYRPQNGYAEQDPNDWWKAAAKALKTVCEKAKGGKISGVGVSGQMHSLVVLDNNGKVLCPAILWCDQRTAKECREMEKAVGKERLFEITASPAVTGFTASKILWIRNNLPKVYAAAAHFLIAKDYIRYMLTGVYATDFSDASGTQLLDVRKRCWSTEICEKLNIDTSLLPELFESPEAAGRVTEKAAKLTGLPAGIPVAAGAGDNAAAAVGMAVCEEGDAFTSIGTSGVVFAPTAKPVIDPRGRVHTFCAAIPGTWHVMGVTLAAGYSIEWFRSQFMENVSLKEMDAECDKLPVGSDNLLYLPYISGERTPVLDPNARGVFFGLSAVHTKYHLARVVMEGVCFSLNQCNEILGEMGVKTEKMTICGGGGKSEVWRRMLCDVYNIPIASAESDEGPARGAAILAAVCCGLYPTIKEACKAMVRINPPCLPDAEKHGKYMNKYALYKKLYPALKDCFIQLSEDR